MHIDISSLVLECEDRLLKVTPISIAYSDKVALKNNELPESIQLDHINIYALWERKIGDNLWVPKYVGQRSIEEGWTRVKQHLFHTPNGTQSKLEYVKAAINSGSDIGVTGILVSPDSMRLTIEDEIIFRNTGSERELPWNDKSRFISLKGTPKSWDRSRKARLNRMELIKSKPAFFKSEI